MRTSPFAAMTSNRNAVCYHFRYPRRKLHSLPPGLCRIAAFELRSSMRKLPCRVLALGCCLLVTPLAWSEPKPALDKSGDPLPTGAIARLGSLRFGCVETPYFLTLPTADGKRIVRAGNSDEMQVLDAINGKELRRVKLE